METAAAPCHAAQSALLYSFDTALNHGFETDKKMPVRTQ
jgi:hypothetical protein